MKKAIIGFLVIIFLIAIILKNSDEVQNSNSDKNEKYYQTIMCNKLKGTMEYTLDDKARIDCLTDEYAIEVDWAKKWAEGIGQALYYAKMTNKKPAVALILGENDSAYLKRLDIVANEFDIKIIKLDKE